MKIILSRKGFDSAAGGYPSPLFINEGKLLSLPIPEDNEDNGTDTKIKYKDLIFKNGIKYSDIMNELGITGFDNKYAHLDPDLKRDTIESRKSNWKGIFGQCSSSQSHLNNQKVEKGDLFLFFGWFRDVKKINGKYSYVKGTDKQLIWGYLQIGEIENIDADSKYEDWKLSHPHYYDRQRKRNTAYIGAENLNFNKNMPGFGVLPYNKSQILTCDGQKNRSIWKLPIFFHPNFNTKMTFHESLVSKSGKPIWKLYNDYCILQSVGRGQEFVISGNEKIEGWAKKLINI